MLSFLGFYFLCVFRFILLVFYCVDNNILLDIGKKVEYDLMITNILTDQAWDP